MQNLNLQMKTQKIKDVLMSIDPEKVLTPFIHPLPVVSISNCGFKCDQSRGKYIEIITGLQSSRIRGK